jgi:hypothetical protein
LIGTEAGAVVDMVFEISANGNKPSLKKTCLEMMIFLVVKL